MDFQGRLTRRVSIPRSILQPALLENGAPSQNGKSNTAPETRVDILFKDVRAMERRAWFGGLRIEELDDPTFHKNERSKPLETIKPGLRVFFPFTSSPLERLPALTLRTEILF